MLIVDDLSQIPEQFRGDYVATGDGKFAHKGHLEVKSDMVKYKNQIGEFSEKLSAYEQEKEAARQEIERKELEKLEKENNYKALRDKDLERFEAEKKQLLSERDALKLEKFNSIKNAQVADLTSVAIDDKARQLMKVVVNSLIKVSDDGSTIYHDINGNPLTDKLDEFKSYISDSGSFANFLPAAQSVGAGAKGSGNGGGAAKTLTRQAFEQLSAEAKMNFSKSGGKIL